MNEPKGDVVRAALGRLTQREYWRRLWILQELHVSQAARVLCGSSELSLHFLCVASAIALPMGKYASFSMVDMLLGSPDMPYRIGPIGDAFEANSLSSPIFWERISRLKCSNFHDRLYALLHVTEWPAGTRPDLIKPDYTLDRIGLILQLGACITAVTRIRYVTYPTLFDARRCLCLFGSGLEVEPAVVQGCWMTLLRELSAGHPDHRIIAGMSRFCEINQITSDLARNGNVINDPVGHKYDPGTILHTKKKNNDDWEH